ncbi:MAG: hypothetical protein Q8Q58_05740, partial [Candidatus Rokubacteria bacterium]|nr:hypothetical protein [Candidatus Rokubacteria bacterium]
AQGAGADWRTVGAATGLPAVQGRRAEALVGRLAARNVTGIGGTYHYSQSQDGYDQGFGACMNGRGYSTR